MSKKDNKSAETEVPTQDKTGEAEVTKKGPITSEDIADDITSREPAPAQKQDTTTPPADDKGEEKKDEKKDGDTTTPPEAKDDDGSKKDVEPFATLGSQKFMTKEELVAFASKQTGYNTWLTGNIKRVHP